MSKIIFLDIDGVLNSNFWNGEHQREISDGTLIDLEKVKLLRQIIDKTDAKIVLHSGWRFWFDSDAKPIRKEALRLVGMLEQEKLGIYDVTPDFSTEEIKRTRKFSLVKASEILAWVEAHPEVSSWIVLDDLDLHSEEIEKHQIKTNQETGLTQENVEQAIRLLQCPIL